MKEQIRSLVKEMEEKGYRDIFRLCEDEFSARKGKECMLEDCLEKAWGEWALNTSVWLSTTFYSAHLEEMMECRFEIRRSEKEQLRVVSMCAKLEHRNERQKFRFDTNRHVHGYNAIQGFFVKKKPWDDMMRGRFGFKK